jgi:nicotinate-nucleotide adenylyltransferase
MAKAEGDSRAMAIGVFGGSFDPPHVAHVFSAAYALAVGDFERLLVVPVFAHAFDKKLAAFEHRVRMCELAFADLPSVEVSRIEERLERPSRTLSTLQAIEREDPGKPLRLVIGSDLLLEAERWHRFEQVVRLAPLFVVGRAGSGQPERGIELPAVSSTRVRELLASSGNPNLERELESLVPRRVLEYARRERLYEPSA